MCAFAGMKGFSMCCAVSVMFCLRWKVQPLFTFLGFIPFTSRKSNIQNERLNELNTQYLKILLGLEHTEMDAVSVTESTPEPGHRVIRVTSLAGSPDYCMVTRFHLCTLALTTESKFRAYLPQCSCVSSQNWNMAFKKNDPNGLIF